jgi:diacylglycerol O-acyltransferase / trehalose O-mycolyltransferase
LSVKAASTAATSFVSSGDGRPGPYEPAGARGDPLERAVLAESRAFAAALRRREIPVQTDFYGRGIHDWPYFERELERALPLLLRPLGTG